MLCELCINQYAVEPLYSGHPWDSYSILIKGGVLTSGVVFCTLFYVAGTVHGILIIGDVLVQGCPYNLHMSWQECACIVQGFCY